MAMDIDRMQACCSPITADGLTENDAAILAEGFKALADPARLRLLSLMVNAGLVTREKRGKWAWYRLVPERLEALRGALAI